MESGDSFDLENLISTPTDEGLPIAPPVSSPPPPLLPSHTNGDLPRSAAAVELQDWKLPAFCSNPTPQELLLNHLAPAIDRLKLSKGGSRSLPSRPSVVNTGLPVMNPWELPGMPLQEGRREKYYLTDLHDLCFTVAGTNNLEAPDGFWKERLGKNGMLALKNEIPTFSLPYFIGHKKSFQFHARGDPSGFGSQTNWIMNVYSLVTGDSRMEDELVICHVFDSPAYDKGSECYTYLRAPICEGLKRSYGADKTPSNSSFISTPRGSSPMHHDVPYQHSDPRLTSYMAHLQNVLFGDPDTSTDTDNWNPIRDIPPIPDDGQSRKRKKNRSDVWDYFTKIYARDRNGEVLTFAACNHCFKLLTGGSSGGTTHLHRHKCSCPCKLQPVAAGRNAQGDMNVLSS